MTTYVFRLPSSPYLNHIKYFQHVLDKHVHFAEIPSRKSLKNLTPGPRGSFVDSYIISKVVYILGVCLSYMIKKKRGCTCGIMTFPVLLLLILMRASVRASKLVMGVSNVDVEIGNNMLSSEIPTTNLVDSGCEST